PKTEYLEIVVKVDDGDRGATIFFFTRLCTTRGADRRRDRIRIESPMRDGDRLQLGGFGVRISVVNAEDDAIEGPKINARPGLELVDVRVGLRKFRRVATENSRHGFIQHPLRVDYRNGIRCRQVTRDVWLRWQRSSSLRRYRHYYEERNRDD